MATLKAYRRALARALDDLGVYTVTATTTSSITSTTLVNGATGASANTYDGRWIYIAAPIQQSRPVSVGGYTAAAGTLNFYPLWTVPSVGAEFDLTALFPVVEGTLTEDTDYRTLVNRALATLVIPDRVSLAITTSDSYSLATWPWLDRDGRLVRVLEPSPVSGRRPMSARWRGPSLVLDGQTPTLELHAPFAAASGSLTLEVLRPADTWINNAESTTGLVADTDTAVPSVEDVVTVGLMHAYHALMSRSPGRPSGNYAAKYEDARAEARKLRYFDKTRELDAPAMPAQGAA